MPDTRSNEYQVGPRKIGPARKVPTFDWISREVSNLVDGGATDGRVNEHCGSDQVGVAATKRPSMTYDCWGSLISCSTLSRSLINVDAGVTIMMPKDLMDAATRRR